MKLLSRLGISLLTMLVVYLGLCFLGPKSFETEREIEKYFDQGLSELSKLTGDTSELHAFAMNLMAREN